MGEGNQLAMTCAGPFAGPPKRFDKYDDGSYAAREQEPEKKFGGDRRIPVERAEIPLHISWRLHMASLVRHRGAVNGAW